MNKDYLAKIAEAKKGKEAAQELFDGESTDDNLKNDDKRIHQTFRIKKNKEMTVRPLRQLGDQEGHIQNNLNGNFGLVEKRKKKTLEGEDSQPGDGKFRNTVHGTKVLF